MNLSPRIGRMSAARACAPRLAPARRGSRPLNISWRFRGLGVDNALVEIDESEVPAVDGSALPFVAAIRDAGIARLRAAPGDKNRRDGSSERWRQLAEFARQTADVSISTWRSRFRAIGTKGSPCRSPRPFSRAKSRRRAASAFCGTPSSFGVRAGAWRLLRKLRHFRRRPRAQSARVRFPDEWRATKCST